MILIADSGSSKTAWWIGNEKARSFNDGQVFMTPGINPYQMSQEQM